MCKSWNAQTSVLCRHCWDAQWCVSITLDKCTLEGGYIGRMYKSHLHCIGSSSLKTMSGRPQPIEKRRYISSNIYWRLLLLQFTRGICITVHCFVQVIKLCPNLVTFFLCLMFTGVSLTDTTWVTRVESSTFENAHRRKRQTIATIVSHNLWLYLHSGQQFEETFENKKEHFNKLGHFLLVALTGAL